MITEQDAFEQILDHLREEKSESTANRYIHEIRRFRAWLESDEFGKSIFAVDMWDVNFYLEYMSSRGHAKATIKTQQTSLSNFYSAVFSIFEDPEQIQYYDLRGNPVGGVSLPFSKRTKDRFDPEEDAYYLTPPQVSRLIKHVPPPNPRNELMLKILYQSGMRPSELLNLKIKHISWTEVTIDAEDPRRDRMVGYSGITCNALDEYTDGGVRATLDPIRKEQYVFQNDDGSPVSYGQLRDIVSEAAEAADIQEVLDVDGYVSAQAPITPITLRHSFAMAAIRQNWRLEVLSKALGQDIETTTRYTQVDQSTVMQSYRVNVITSDATFSEE